MVHLKHSSNLSHPILLSFAGRIQRTLDNRSALKPSLPKPTTLCEDSNLTTESTSSQVHKTGFKVELAEWKMSLRHQLTTLQNNFSTDRFPQLPDCCITSILTKRATKTHISRTTIGLTLNKDLIHTSSITIRDLLTKTGMILFMDNSEDLQYSTLTLST